MSFVRTIWLAIVIAIATLPAPVAAATCSELVIGATLSLTGRFSTEGVLTRNGYEFAIEQIKQAGGIRIGDKCYDLRVIYYDDESSPERGASVAQRLIKNDRVRYMLGPNSAAVADEVADLTEAARIPMLAPQGMPRAAFAKGRKYLFGLLTVSERHLSAALDLAASVATNIGRSKTSAKIALVTTGDPFVADLRTGLIEEAGRRGMEIAANETLSDDLSGIPSTLSKVRLAQPDILLVAGHAKAIVAAARQIDELQIHVPILAMTRCEAADIVARVGEAASNIICAARTADQRTGAISVPGASANLGAFETAYKTRFKQPAKPLPDAVAQAATAVYVFADALRRAGSLDSEKFREALAATDMATFFGRLSFAAVGNALVAPMIWRQIHGGKYHTVAPPGRATHNLQWPRRGL